MLVGHAAPALAAGVTAGTLIENTAVASFDEAGTPRSINSNTVVVRVDELLDVTVTSLDPGPVTARAGDAVLTFEVTNQGNGPEAFRLTAETAVAGNDFDVTLRAIRPVAKVGIRGFPFGVKSDSRFGCRGFALSG